MNDCYQGREVNNSKDKMSAVKIPSSVSEIKMSLKRWTIWTTEPKRWWCWCFQIWSLPTSQSPFMNMHTLAQTSSWKSESHSFMSNSLSPHGLTMEFFRPEYWSGWPSPSPRALSNPGIEPRSPALQADSLPAEPPRKPDYASTLSLKLPQFCCSRRHCFGKYPQYSYLLQVINSSFSQSLDW